MAREAGVTRLADVTGLDCLGVPVWQAVRPWSRALSVHQGKGPTAAIARRGAVMEAIESHHAEHWQPDPAAVIANRRWQDLEHGPSQPTPADFAASDRAPADTCDWIAVEPLGGSTGFFVPVAAVGLDCTASMDHGIGVDSNGLAAHFDVAAATLSALLECVERDAVAQWRRSSPAVRSTSALTPGTACPLVRDWAARCARRGIAVRLYGLDAAAPVAVAELHAPGADRAEHRHVWGSAAGLDWPSAVRAALLEALQTRCSQIAGSRDTIPLRSARRADHGGFGLPPSADWPGHPLPGATIAGLDGALAALAHSGRHLAGRLILSPPQSLAVTVKVFVPGLGFEGRASRPS